MPRCHTTKNRDKSGGQVVDKPDSKRLRGQIELGRRLMSSVDSVQDRETILAYVTKLEAELEQAEDNEDVNR